MPAQDEAVDLATTACAAAVDKKATDPLVLDVADLLGVVEVFVLASAANDRQLRAVAQEVEHQVREQLDRRPLRREGTPDSGWVLLDYGDAVCHLFLAAQREFYDLERLWSDVPRRDPETGELREPLQAVAEGRG